MWKMLLIAAATTAGLALSMTAVEAQRTDVDVDEGLIRPAKPSVQPRNQATPTRTRNSANDNPRAYGGSKTGSDCRPTGSRRCPPPASR